MISVDKDNKYIYKNIHKLLLIKNMKNCLLLIINGLIINMYIYMVPLRIRNWRRKLKLGKLMEMICIKISIRV